MQLVILNLLQLMQIPTESPRVNGLNDTIPSDSVCYDIYKSKICFPMTDPWVDKANEDQIPIPRSPDEIGTTFYLYSRRNRSHPQKIAPYDVQSMMQSALMSENPLRIIIHGYLASSNSYWLKNMVGEILRSSDENVLTIDWSKGAERPYPQAMSNIRVVAVQLAYLLHVITTYTKTPPSSLHVIGYSLGAHMAGLTGAYLRDVYNLTLPRITGLDPAGPYFVGSDPISRLDPTDASFVDVIHTNISPIFGFPVSLGINNTVGHLDFFPNGAKEQPKCNGNWKCEHQRSSLLFTESIRQPCSFTGIVCASFEEFQKGNCWGCENESCSTMGIKANPLRNQPQQTRFYLMTRKSSPYCGTHYRVTIQTSDSKAAKGIGGEFAIVGLALNGERETSQEIKLSEKSVYYKANETYRQVVLSNVIGELVSIDVVFRFPSSYLNIFSWRIRTPVLHLAAITIEELKPARRWKFCFKKEALRRDVVYTLNKSSYC